MRAFARLPWKERADVFTIVANAKGVPPAIVEKDFWVCWTLNYLFGESKFKDSFAFKGGTSLSKGFDPIERFSEDVDLIFDWRLLGYGLDELWEKRSNTKQDAFVDKINGDPVRFLESELVPEMRWYLDSQQVPDARLLRTSTTPKHFVSPIRNRFPIT